MPFSLGGISKSAATVTHPLVELPWRGIFVFLHENLPRKNGQMPGTECHRERLTLPTLPNPLAKNTLGNSLWSHAYLFWTVTLPVHDCGHQQLGTATEGWKSVPERWHGWLCLLMSLKRWSALINHSSRDFYRQTAYSVGLPLSHLPAAWDEIPWLVWTSLLRLTELLFLDGNLPSCISSQWDRMSRLYLHQTGWGNPIQKWLFPRLVTRHYVSFPAPILLHKQDDIWELCLKKRAWLGHAW